MRRHDDVLTMMTRRQAIVRLAVVTALGAAGPASALIHRGGSISIQGVFPTADPAFLPMRQVYPAPSGVQSYEGHQIAYYKPSNGDTCLYRTRIGVSFGRWPYRYSLVSGPPGMAFVATAWNTAWDGQGDLAFKNGYGVLQWTPAAAISSGTPTTVSVDVTDQDGLTLNVQFPIWTSDDVANGGVVSFLNADTGNDTTGNGSKASPWQTIGKAYGINGGSAPAAAIGGKCYMRGATAQYWLPPTASGGHTTTVNATTTPATLIGYPGETATVDLTGAADSGAAAYFVTVGGPGLNFQDFTMNGYNTGAGNLKLFSMSSINRVSFIGIIANNTGYGNDFTNNSSLFYAIGGSPSFGQYLFITGCEENNRQSNSGANNASIHELYSYQDVLTELNAANSPGNHLGNTIFCKSDIAYACIRANFINCLTAVTGFSYFQCPYQNTQNCQSCYNVGININNLEVPGVSGYSYGNLLANRNSIISANGLVCNDASVNLVAPYTHANVLSGTPFGLTIAAPSVNSAGGTLGVGPWYYSMTSVGVTGETAISTTNGANGVPVTGLSGSTNAITLSFLLVPYAASTKLYRIQGAVISFGAITGGSGYTNGTYTNVALTGGTGTGAKATVVVSGGAVTSVSIPAGDNAGTGYLATDSLSAAAASIGGTGSGFSVALSTVSSTPSGANQFVSIASGSTFVDDGTATWTAGSPPTTNTAISASRFSFNTNVVQSTASPPANVAPVSTSNNQYGTSLLNTSTGLLLVSNGGLYGAQLA